MSLDLAQIILQAQVEDIARRVFREESSAIAAEVRSTVSRTRLADATEHQHELREKLLNLRDTTRQRLEAASKPSYNVEDFAESTFKMLDGVLDRERLVTLFEPLCDTGDLRRISALIDALLVAHRSSPSSMGGTSKVRRGGSAAPAPAPYSDGDAS